MGITSGEVAKGNDFCTCIDVNDLYFCVVCVAMLDVRVSIPKIFSPCHRIPGDCRRSPVCHWRCVLFDLLREELMPMPLLPCSKWSVHDLEDKKRLHGQDAFYRSPPAR